MTTMPIEKSIRGPLPVWKNGIELLIPMSWMLSVNDRPRKTKNAVLMKNETSEWNVFIRSSKTSSDFILNILATSSLLPSTSPKMSAATKPLPSTISTPLYNMRSAAIVIMKENGLPWKTFSVLSQIIPNTSPATIAIEKDFTTEAATMAPVPSPVMNWMRDRTSTTHSTSDITDSSERRERVSSLTFILRIRPSTTALDVPPSIAPSKRLMMKGYPKINIKTAVIMNIESPNPTAA